MKISQKIIQEFEDLAHRTIFASCIFGIQTLPLPSSFLNYGHSNFFFAIFILDSSVQTSPSLSSFFHYGCSNSHLLSSIWISSFQTLPLLSSLTYLRHSNFAITIFRLDFRPSDFACPTFISKFQAFKLRLCYLQFIFLAFQT